MNELQLLLGAVARLVWEGKTPLLRRHAGVAELLDMVDGRHPLHHLLSTELPQGHKVEVPKALVPTPHIVIVASCKAKGLHHLGMENVEAVAPPAHICEKSVISVQDAKQSMLDLHT